MKKAFTLVELIVVVIILGILAAVGIPQYRKALERARGAEAYAGLGSVQEGEKIYFATNEAYLTTDAPMTAQQQRDLDIALPQAGWQLGVVLGAAPATFTATATRIGNGPCTGRRMTTDQTGIIIQSVTPAVPTVWWKDCVDAL